MQASSHLILGPMLAFCSEGWQVHRLTDVVGTRPFPLASTKVSYFRMAVPICPWSNPSIRPEECGDEQGQQCELSESLSSKQKVIPCTRTLQWLRKETSGA
ncbi:hypothetical protein BJY01DRAFT_184808 [Aspergillus pseudoustus]|uniref:Uncharacterized protein n=1 Tax=Aspergillus pseudoustus TaxID=1810923 RepID=A0ABR4JY76_9EURO